MSQFSTYIVSTMLKLMPTTQLRVWLLRRLGSSIGSNCRIHAIEFLNAGKGFSRLRIGSNCYIGHGVLIDLAGTINIADGAVISTRSILLSHDDPGSTHNSPLCRIYPPHTATTSIERFAWLGAGSIVTAGSRVGEECVLAAGSVAKGTLAPRSLYAGQPAILKRRFAAQC